MASGFSSTQRAKGDPGMSGKVTPNLEMSLLLSILQPTAKEATPHFFAPFWTSLVIESNTWRETNMTIMLLLMVVMVMGMRCSKEYQCDDQI